MYILTCTHTHTHTRTHTYSHIVVSWGARDACHVTDLLVVDLRSSLAYSMMTHPLPIAGKLPIKTLVARQLPTNAHTCIVHTHTHTCTVAHRYMRLPHVQTLSQEFAKERVKRTGKHNESW